MKAVDLFSGFGGSSCGAQMAGVEVVYAANHWQVAVHVHSANHPEAQHECQDLRQADFSLLPEHDLLLASSSCQGSSQAGQPGRKRSPRVQATHDAYRASAWAVVDCAQVTRPKALIVENVTDLRRWELFDVWSLALERLGYHLQTHVLSATDHGVPQRRKRLFIVGTLRPVLLRFPRAVSEPAFAGCVEADAIGWKRIRDCRYDRARASLLDASRRHGDCLVQYVTGHKGIPLSEPIRTITTKDQWRLVGNGQYRPLTLREYARGMGFPDSYTWPSELRREVVVRGLGNAVPPPMMRDVVRAVAEVAQ